MSETNQPYDLAHIESLDSEHQRLIAERLHFLDFTRTIKKTCRCDQPAFVLESGPTEGERRRVECGTCHTFLAWLPKFHNKANRKTSSTHLATAGYCQLCRKMGANLVGHHVIEVQEGGSNAPENIWTVCEPCHAVIHALRRIAKAAT